MAKNIDKFLTMMEVKIILKKSYQTLYNWMKNKEELQPTKIIENIAGGRKPKYLYLEKNVLEYLKLQTQKEEQKARLKTMDLIQLRGAAKLLNISTEKLKDWHINQNKYNKEDIILPVEVRKYKQTIRLYDKQEVMQFTSRYKNNTKVVIDLQSQIANIKQNLQDIINKI